MLIILEVIVALRILIFTSELLIIGLYKDHTAKKSCSSNALSVTSVFFHDSPLL